MRTHNAPIFIRIGYNRPSVSIAPRPIASEFPIEKLGKSIGGEILLRPNISPFVVRIALFAIVRPPHRCGVFGREIREIARWGSQPAALVSRLSPSRSFYFGSSRLSIRFPPPVFSYNHIEIIINITWRKEIQNNLLMVRSCEIRLTGHAQKDVPHSVHFPTVPRLLRIFFLRCLITISQNFILRGLVSISQRAA